MADDQNELTLGQVIGHYQIVSQLGSGGMGEVYLAQDIKLDRKVALKVLPGDAASHQDRMRRFIQEAKAASALNHPNIITIHEIDETDSIHFIATEGSNTNEIVASILSDKEPLPLFRYAREVPPELERIAAKALSKEREDRYQSAKDLLIDLRHLKKHLEVEAELERSKPPDIMTGQTTVPETSSTGSGQAAQAVTLTESLANKIKPNRRILTIAATVLTVLVATLIYLFYVARPSRAIDSIAVLPLSNTANDLNTEYLSDGITESIISNLSQLSQLKVMARSTVFHFKGKEIDPREVGRQLGVRAVMSGRLLQQGDHLIVRAELVNVADGAQLWGAEYDRKLSDVLALQQEISREISENLRLKLTGEEKKRLAGRDTKNAEAYQLYLLGRFHFYKFTEAEVRKSIDSFNQALAKDPNYALANHGLSDAYAVLGQIGFRPNEVLPKSLVYADKALAADPTLPEAHLSRGAYELWYGWNWPMAEQELKRAMALNPNLADTHNLYGIFLSAMGQFDAAIAENKHALELDPLSPITISNLGGVYYWARQYDLAIEQNRKVMELDTNFFLAPLIIGQAYGQQRKYTEAIEQLTKTRDLPGGFAPATSELGYIYAVSGQRTKAQELLRELQDRAKLEFIDPYYVTIIYVGLGQQDETLAWLNKAYDERSFWLFWLRVEPKFDHLRSDSRYKDLVRSMNFPS